MLLNTVQLVTFAWCVWHNSHEPILAYINTKYRQDTNNMHSTQLSGCTLLLPFMKEAVTTPGVGYICSIVGKQWAGAWDGLCSFHRTAGVADGCWGRTDLQNVSWSNTPLFHHVTHTQSVTPPSPRKHTHSLLPITSRHRTLTSHTIFIPSALP